jgi:MEMO1 family protein
MITLAGITPHSPLLLPEVHSERISILEQTTRALDALSHSLYAAKIETIVLISEHPTRYKTSFSVNMHDPYTIDLREFGVPHCHHSYKPDLQLIDKLQRHLRREDQPFSLTTDTNLSFAAATPLHYLATPLKKVRIVPITYSELDVKAHFKFGQSLQDVLMQSDKRIAVIAAGDMSHTLSEDSPAAHHVSGEEYDTAMQHALVHGRPEDVLNFKQSMVTEAQETSYRPISILLGALDDMHYKAKVLSYEHPFGVGYLTAEIEIH